MPRNTKTEVPSLKIPWPQSKVAPPAEGAGTGLRMVQVATCRNPRFATWIPIDCFSSPQYFWINFWINQHVSWLHPHVFIAASRPHLKPRMAAKHSSCPRKPPRMRGPKLKESMSDRAPTVTMEPTWEAGQISEISCGCTWRDNM